MVFSVLFELLLTAKKMFDPFSELEIHKKKIIPNDPE